MIELRWVERPVWRVVEKYDTHQTEHRKIDRVLQYRLQTGNRIANDDGATLGVIHTWTDWQDVPTVSEESDVRA